MGEPLGPDEARLTMVDDALEVLRVRWGYRTVQQMDPHSAWRDRMTEIVDTISAEWIKKLADLEADHARLREALAGIYDWARDHLELDRDASPLDVTSLIQRFEADSVAYRNLLEAANPDLTAAVAHAIRLSVDTGSTLTGVARAAIQATFRHYETAYVDEDHQGSNLLALYIELMQEFNLLNARRCLRYTCDHLETVHNNTGCERCSCPELTRKPTG